ncbi:DUF1641 domain-containing protein [Pseudomonas sp.]|uniref:DUF1641 domain-containing protein n=1 Tax=Pseudomonas sp. TaxID=306 RepID=UPI002729B232|nr:hypothetical protein [Pseudomonas sp.]
MAKAIKFETPANPRPDPARKELDDLLQNLHETGVLRLSNDILRSLPELAVILLRGMNSEKSTNAMQNLSLLLNGLGSIPPERFQVVMRAATEALESMEQQAKPEGEASQPGFRAAYRLLRDEELWQGMGPIIAGIKGFSRRIHEAPAQPAAKRHDGEGLD